MSIMAGKKLSSGPVKSRTATTTEKSPAELAVRKQLEEVIDRKKKSGKKARFHLDPERKKKLKALLLKNAAEVIKADQEKKAQERRRAVMESIGKEEHSNVQDEARLIEICKKYHDRIRQLHEAKYELEVIVRKRDYCLNESTIQVNQLRGKFIKPSLKSINTATSVNSKSSTMDVQNKEFVRSCRRVLRVSSMNNHSGQAEDTWRTGTSRPDWVTQTSRKSDFGDIPEQDA